MIKTRHQAREENTIAILNAIYNDMPCQTIHVYERPYILLFDTNEVYDNQNLVGNYCPETKTVLLFDGNHCQIIL